MYPLPDWKSIKRGYLFKQWTFYNTQHLGTDYCVPNGTQIVAPFNGTVTIKVGVELGNTIFFKPDNIDVIIRMGHLQEFQNTGWVTAGTPIGLSDHTGSLAGDVSHVHLDISKHSLQLNNINNFLDPETFNWDSTSVIPVDFQLIWHRPAAQGEIKYFSRRLLNGSIKDEADLRDKMQYWYGIVYPNGKYSIIGDARWQIEKLK